MLNDRQIPDCRRCYELEESGMRTLRNSSLENFGHHFDKVLGTHDDGTVDELNMAYLDIRFSNLCNMSCRTCGPQFSTGWYDDHKKIHGDPGHPKVLQVSKNMKTWFEKLKDVLDTVEEVYFAGGEPLITEEHYKILDYWIETNKKDVRIGYTTNFSLMNYKKKSIYDYWNSFGNVRVAASLDATWERGEYLRKGTNWDRTVQNRKTMIEKCPDVYFEITPTVSIFNCFNLPDFHKEWVESGLLEVDNIRINILLDPTEMRLQILPDMLKDKLRKRYQEHIDWLNTFTEKPHNALSGFKNLLYFIEQKDYSDKIPMFKEITDRVDSVRNESFIETYPELKELYDVE